MNLKQKLAKGNAQVFSFPFKEDLSLAKKQTAYRTNSVKNWVETVKLEVRQPPMFPHTHTHIFVNYLTYIKNIYGLEISGHWIENNVKLGTRSVLKEHTHHNA